MSVLDPLQSSRVHPGLLTFYGQLSVIGHSNPFVRVDDAAVAARVALGCVLHVKGADEAPVVPRFGGFHWSLPPADALFRIRQKQQCTQKPRGRVKVAPPCVFTEA